jgi:hypothetical protein
MSKDTPFSKDLDKIIRQIEKDDLETLRDQFAMAALTGLLNSGGMSGDPLEDAAEAYKYADAMLKAREAK